MNERGFGLDPKDFDEVGYLLVKAGVAETAEALAEMKSAKVRGNALGRNLKGEGWVVFQFKGDDWSIFQCAAGDDRLPQRLTTRLETEALYYHHEDTAGWTNLSLYSSGEAVEEFAFGLDYTEDLAEFVDEIEDDGSEWDHDIRQEGDQILFRSKRRKIEPESLEKTEEFLDEMMRMQGAWLPPAERMPAPIGRCQGEAEQFEGVLLVKR